MSPGLGPLWLPFIDVPVRMTARVIREPRGRCVNCQVRRVLYRIEVGTHLSADRTEARCARCWGLR